MSGGDEFVDLAFGLAGDSVPEDYADPLLQALRALLPWLEEDETAAVHPLARISPGQGRRTYLSKYTRLTLRLNAARVEAARALSGARLDLGGPVEVGEAKVRVLAPAKVMFSHFVALGLDEEEAFVAECHRQLAALGVEAQMIVGRPQAMKVEGLPVRGFGLMVHGLRAEDSLRLQSVGLGAQRKRGCGIFVQHKAVVAVGGD